MTDDKLRQSWGAFSQDLAAKYLTTFGASAASSKALLADVLVQHARGRTLQLVDLGCGNAQLCEVFDQRGLRFHYTGVDFSAPLLEAARAAFEGRPNVAFVQDDVSDPRDLTGPFDVAVYSHVIETLASPEQSLLKARAFAEAIAIRFYEPPDFEVDTVELREMPVAEGRTVPYLRRKMSRDYYRLLLTKLGCQRVDVYRDDHSKDQVHLLHFQGAH